MLLKTIITILVIALPNLVYAAVTVPEGGFSVARMPSEKIQLIKREIAKKDKIVDEKIEFIKKVITAQNRPQGINNAQDITTLKLIKNILDSEDLPNPDARVYEIQTLLGD